MCKDLPFDYPSPKASYLIVDGPNHLFSCTTYLMKENESPDVDSRSPGSEQGGSTSGFQLSAKLTDKMKKLARWRIAPSSIEFPEAAVEFKGGNATVSRAFLASPFDARDRTDKSNAPDSAGRKVVAVKKLKIAPDKDTERAVGLTLREAGFLTEISHENIVKLEGFVENVSNGIIWLVFPWEGNGNLRDFLASRNWEIPERIWLIDDVARGVEYLHTRTPPICHGDLKSINILVNSGYRAVITDFGSARRLANDDLGTQMKQPETKAQLATSFEATFCTSTNTITLTGNEYTLRWAAPELLMDERPSPWSDMWAWGWVAYEVMTNTIPFQDVRKDSVVIKRVIEGDLPSLTGDTRMSLVQALCSLMISCWSIDPTKRPTAEDCQKSMGWMPMIVPNSMRMVAGAGPEAHLPYLLHQLGEMPQAQGDYPNAVKFFNWTLDTCTATGDSKGRAFALWSLAVLHREQNMTDEAATFYSEALQTFTDIGETHGRAAILCDLARIYRIRKEYDQAITSSSEALQISTDTGNASLGVYALWGLAEVHREREEYSQALGFYSDALQVSIEIGHRRGSVEALWGLFFVHRAQKEYSQATAFCEQALQIWADLANPDWRAPFLRSLATSCRAQNHNKAIEMYTRAAECYERSGRTGSAAQTLKDAADVRRLFELQQATGSPTEPLSNTCQSRSM